jgi:hypothetical protein
MLSVSNEAQLQQLRSGDRTSNTMFLVKSKSAIIQQLG